jgi:type I restriction enzyme S subunit
MELEMKNNFKQTEVGLIPEDWEVFDLNQVLIGIADVDHYMPKTEKYGIPYVMTGDLQLLASDIDFDNCKKISENAYTKLARKVKNKKGDIILARYATVGTVCFVDFDFDFVVSYSCVNIKTDTSKLFGLLLYYYFQSSIFRLEVKNKVNGNIQDNVGIGDLYTMKIPLPPTLEEQKAIATALSDVDNLITNLDHLITKKKAIKQGAMQRLLTPPHLGGKRLSGFDGEWVEKSLGEVSQMNSGGTPSSKVLEYYDGDIDWVSISDITRAGKYIDFSLKKITESGLLNSSARLFPKNTVLLAMYASIGKCVISTIETSTSQAILGITVSNALDKEFLYYFLIYKRDELANQGQQGTQSNLNKAMIQAIIIDLPSKPEQKAIIAILSDMDNELEELEAKKQKYQDIKQGMMQELLTGKTRLG